MVRPALLMARRVEPMHEPMNEYLASDATSRSEVAAALRGAEWYAYYLNREYEETDATRFGTYVHALLLEPDEALCRYAIEPTTIGRLTKKGQPSKTPRSTESYKQDVRYIVESGRKVVTDEDWERAYVMQRQILAHPIAGSLFDGSGVTERSIYFDLLGEPCKIRPDLVTPGRVCVDLKTYGKPLEGFDRDVFRRDYDLSPWLYSQGIEGCAGFLWVVVESQPPHRVRVLTAGPSMMAHSEHRFLRGLAMLCDHRADATVAPTWDGIEDVAVPEWVQAADTEITFG